MSAIAQRYEAVRRRVADAADCAGRSGDDVRIIAVTKTVGPAEVKAASDAGIRDFGENRVQEFTGKYGLFPDLNWHFIGTLQTNKVKDLIGRAHLIHSVDTEHLLTTIDRRAAVAGVVQPVLIQVNISGEGSKHGISPVELPDVLSVASDAENVEVRGLMTMAPFVRPEDARWVFRELRELRDSLSTLGLNGVELVELSMGMSNDFEVAVEEGATIVRVGRAIFGR